MRVTADYASWAEWREKRAPAPLCPECNDPRWRFQKVGGENVYAIFRKREKVVRLIPRGGYERVVTYR